MVLKTPFAVRCGQRCCHSSESDGTGCVRWGGGRGGADRTPDARSGPMRGAPTLRKEKLGPQYLPYIGSRKEGGGMEGGGGRKAREGLYITAPAPLPQDRVARSFWGREGGDPPGWGLRCPRPSPGAGRAAHGADLITRPRAPAAGTQRALIPAHPSPFPAPSPRPPLTVIRGMFFFPW